MNIALCHVIQDSTFYDIQYITYRTVTQVGLSLFCVVCFIISKQTEDITSNFKSDLEPYHEIVCVMKLDAFRIHRRKLGESRYY